MGTVKLKRYQRRKNIGDSSSPLYYYLRQKPDSGQLYNINRIASEIEGIGALSVEDVEHVIKSLVRSMKQILREKLDNFGTFYITFRCPGVETAAKCSVKNITRVNIRFLADNTLKLVNESTVTTKGALNNVVFELEKLESGSGSGGSDSGGDGGLDENQILNLRKEVWKIMAIKKTVWDLILKVVIAVASAIAGVVGANAMPL